MAKASKNKPGTAAAKPGKKNKPGTAAAKPGKKNKPGTAAAKPGKKNKPGTAAQQPAKRNKRVKKDEPLQAWQRDEHMQCAPDESINDQAAE